MSKAKNLVTKKALTPAQFYELQAVPPVIEWFANIDNTNTRKTYQRTVKEFMSFTGLKNPDDFRVVTRAHIIAYRKSVEARGVSPATVRTKLSALSALFNHLCECNAVLINPVLGVKRPKVENPNEGKTPTLSDAEVRVLLDAPDPQTLKGKRDKAILAVLLFHGIRREELVSLKIKDMHNRAGLLHFKIKGKGGRIRNVPVAPSAQQLISDYLDAAPLSSAANPPLFRPVRNNVSGTLDKALSPGAIYYNVIKHYARKAGVNAEHICVHSTRATSATNALNNKADLVDVQQWLGHANIATTKLYVRSESKAEDSPSFRVNYKP